MQFFSYFLKATHEHPKWPNLVCFLFFRPFRVFTCQHFCQERDVEDGRYIAGLQSKRSQHPLSPKSLRPILAKVRHTLQPLLSSIQFSQSISLSSFKLKASQCTDQRRITSLIPGVLDKPNWPQEKTNRAPELRCSPIIMQMRLLERQPLVRNRLHFLLTTADLDHTCYI